MKDLRTPIGVYFGVVGGLLVSVPNARAALTGAPVNLYAGLSMLAFGGVMLWLGLGKTGR